MTGLSLATVSVAHVGDATRTALGVIALSTLLALLVLREMARAGLSGARARRVEDLRAVIWPLGVVFVAVIAPRIWGLVT